MPHFNAFLLLVLLMFTVFRFFSLSLSFLRRTELKRLRNYHRLQKVIETITMQQAIKSTITQRNSIHTSQYTMMKLKTLAISTEMVSGSMNFNIPTDFDIISTITTDLLFFSL